MANGDHNYGLGPKRGKRSTKYCSVPQCNNYGGTGLSFHEYPKDDALRKKWEAALKMGKPASRTMMVCSAHFLANDYFPGDGKKVRRLKIGVVPSVNLTVRSHEKLMTSVSRESKDARAMRVCNRGLKRMSDEVPELRDESNVDVSSESHEMEETVDKPEKRLKVDGNVNQASHRSIQTQTERHLPSILSPSSSSGSLFKIKFLDLLMNDKVKLKNFTGLHSFELLDALEECVADLYVAKSVRPKELSLKNRILLFFIKIKQNLSFTSLAILFGIHRRTCVGFFTNVVHRLAIVLENMIPWPDHEVIRGNLPIAFRNYRDTRIIFDCAETPLEKCKCLRCRILTYSNYKGTHTVKWNVCVSPSGMIISVSKAYGGRASDKFIVNHSGILNKLDYRDAVMVDKGYKIEKECLERNLILYQPPFVYQKKQMSREDAMRCAEIARARVHVERVIQRMREFSFIAECIPWELVAFVDDIITIICGIVNLSSPVLNIDKFM